MNRSHCVRNLLVLSLSLLALHSPAHATTIQINDNILDNLNYYGNINGYFDVDSMMPSYRHSITGGYMRFSFYDGQDHNYEYAGDVYGPYSLYRSTSHEDWRFLFWSQVDIDKYYQRSANHKFIDNDYATVSVAGMTYSASARKYSDSEPAGAVPSGRNHFEYNSDPFTTVILDEWFTTNWRNAYEFTAGSFFISLRLTAPVIQSIMETGGLSFSTWSTGLMLNSASLFVDVERGTAPIPEPATLLLMSTGMAGLVVLLRRKK